MENKTQNKNKFKSKKPMDLMGKRTFWVWVFKMLLNWNKSSNEMACHKTNEGNWVLPFFLITFFFS